MGLYIDTHELQANRNILQLDFNMFENTLQLYDAAPLLGLEDEVDLVRDSGSKGDAS